MSDTTTKAPTKAPISPEIGAHTAKEATNPSHQLLSLLLDLRTVAMMSARIVPMPAPTAPPPNAPISGGKRMAALGQKQPLNDLEFYHLSGWYWGKADTRHSEYLGVRAAGFGH
jgi:hypothetical protein